MSIPIIAYSNHFENAVSVVASSEATGFEKENAYDYRADDWWKPNSGTIHTLTYDYGSPKNINCAALCFHDLSMQGATVEVRGSTDNFSASDVLLHTFTLNGDKAILEAFTGGTYQYGRLEIYKGSAFQFLLGHGFIGEKYELPHGLRVGWQNIYDNRKVHVINNKAQNGNFLGRSLINQGVEGTLKFEFMTETIMRGVFRTFLDHAEVKPFMFNRNPGTYDDESLFLWMMPKGLRAPTSTHLNPYYTATMKVEGVAE